MVTGLETTDEGDQQRISGIRTYFGSVYGAEAVILTAGTFLGGRIWVATNPWPPAALVNRPQKA